MTYSAPLPDASSDELVRITRRIRNSLDAMSEARTNVWAHILAIGDNLNIAHDSLVPKRKWGRFLKQFGLSRTNAFNYGCLAKHRAEVEAFVQRAEQSGRPLKIRAALRLLGPPRPRTPRPKTFPEIEQPPALGHFLEQHQELVFEALAHAPGLKAKIVERLARPLGKKQEKARRKRERELATLPPLVARGDSASIH